MQGDRRQHRRSHAQRDLPSRLRRSVEGATGEDGRGERPKSPDESPSEHNRGQPIAAATQPEEEAGRRPQHDEPRAHDLDR